MRAERDSTAGTANSPTMSTDLTDLSPAPPGLDKRDWIAGLERGVSQNSLPSLAT